MGIFQYCICTVCVLFLGLILLVQCINFPSGRASLFERFVGNFKTGGEILLIFTFNTLTYKQVIHVCSPLTNQLCFSRGFSHRKEIHRAEKILINSHIFGRLNVRTVTVNLQPRWLVTLSLFLQAADR